jgi:hypothetical protein
MPVPVELNKQLHALLAQTNNMQAKPYLVESFTNGRTQHSSEMSHYEAIELVKHLKGIKAQQTTANAPARVHNSEPTHIGNVMPAVGKKTDKERANPMRKKIIALAHQMGWSTYHPDSGKKIADMPRINAWCSKYGYLHKALNAYTIEELPKLVTQFDNLYKSFLKGF